MSCTMHVASTIYVSHSLKAQKKNNSSRDTFTQLGLEKTISFAAKWIADITTKNTPY